MRAVIVEDLVKMASISRAPAARVDRLVLMRYSVLLVLKGCSFQLQFNSVKNQLSLLVH